MPGPHVHGLHCKAWAVLSRGQSEGAELSILEALALNRESRGWDSMGAFGVEERTLNLESKGTRAQVVAPPLTL